MRSHRLFALVVLAAVLAVLSGTVLADTNVVTAANPQGWAIIPAPGTNAPGFSGFVSSPQFPPPLGTGAYRVRIEGSNQKTIFGRFDLNGYLLSDFTEFTYDVIGLGTNFQQFYANIYLDVTGDAVPDLRLSMVAPPSVLAWGTIDGLTTLYYVSTYGGYTYSGPNPGTIAQIVTAEPTATIADAFGQPGNPGFRLNMGDTASSYVGFDGMIDNVRLTVTGYGSEVWDFEELSSSLQVAGGQFQSTDVNTAFGSALTVTVRDSGGAPVVNVPVTFSAPTSGASATFTGGVTSVTAFTDVAGVASSGPVTANGTAGSYLVDAWIANDSSVPGVLFQLTNTGGTVTPTETELVLNGSFETVDIGQSSGVADWKLNTGGKGKQDCTKFSDGACSYRLKAKNVTSLKQKIVAPPMEAGDLLRFSASVEGKNAVSSLVSATAKVKYVNGTKFSVVLAIPDGTFSFASLESSMGIWGDVKKVIIKLTANPGGGKVWFDEVSAVVVEDGLRDARGAGGVLPPPAAPKGWR